ncbi:MAG: hypothetical protein ABEJ70_05065 [Halobacteriaceae archaeon]
MPFDQKHVESDFEPFVLDDGTGTAYVDPGDADLLLSEDARTEVDRGEEPPTFVRTYLTRETDLDLVGNRERRYTEARLDIDGQVRISGQADPDAAPALDDPVTTAVVRAGDAPKFLVSDDPDLGLGRRLRQEAVVYLFLAAVCLAVAYVVVG